MDTAGWRRRPRPRALTKAKLEHVQETNGYLVGNPGPAVFRITLKNDKRGSDTSVNYSTVYLGQPHRCSCEEFQLDKKLCTHILWVMVKVLGMKHDDSRVWQLSLPPREIDNIIANRVKRYSYRVAKPEEVPRGRSEMMEGDTCPICMQDLPARHMYMLSYCRGCGKNVHTACLQTLLKSHGAKLARARVVECPLCRGKFCSREQLESDTMYNTQESTHRKELCVQVTSDVIVCTHCQARTNEFIYRCKVCRECLLCGECYPKGARSHAHKPFQYRISKECKWVDAPPPRDRIDEERLQGVERLLHRDLGPDDYDALLELDSHIYESDSDGQSAMSISDYYGQPSWYRSEPPPPSSASPPSSQSLPSSSPASPSPSSALLRLPMLHPTQASNTHAQANAKARAAPTLPVLIYNRRLRNGFFVRDIVTTSHRIYPHPSYGAQDRRPCPFCKIRFRLDDSVVKTDCGCWYHFNCAYTAFAYSGFCVRDGKFLAAEQCSFRKVREAVLDHHVSVVMVTKESLLQEHRNLRCPRCTRRLEEGDDVLIAHCDCTYHVDCAADRVGRRNRCPHVRHAPGGAMVLCAPQDRYLKLMVSGRVAKHAPEASLTDHTIRQHTAPATPRTPPRKPGRLRSLPIETSHWLLAERDYWHERTTMRQLESSRADRRSSRADRRNTAITSR